MLIQKNLAKIKTMKKDELLDYLLKQRQEISDQQQTIKEQEDEIKWIKKRLRTLLRNQKKTSKK